MRQSATEYEPLTLPGCEDMVTENGSDPPPVHPVAAMFPMMSDTELDDLAADIQANGLVHPIVRGANGQLIDGRNRLRACEIAGVEPRFTTLSADVDPVAFILSCNVQRRQMNKGQTAMAVVQAKFFSGEKVWGEQVAAALALKISNTGLSKAVVVSEYAPELVTAVISAAVGLNEAYAIAQDAKARAEGRDLAAEAAATNLRRLQAEANDLAERVLEDTLTIDEAIAILDRRLADERDRRTLRTKAFANGAAQLWGTLFGESASLAADWLPEANPWAVARNPAGVGVAHLWTAGGLRDLAALIITLAETVEERGGQL